LLGQSAGRVIRIGRSLEVFQVTGYARSRGQVVISVGVALRALHLRMRTRQRKRRPGMIETGRLPGRRRMADFALLRHASRDVIRIRRSLKIFDVTRDASSGGYVVVAIGVALVALQLCVSTCKRKANRIMIEIRGLPSGGRVAILAGLG
jgi:hydrogenase maturation factor